MKGVLAFASLFVMATPGWSQLETYSVNPSFAFSQDFLGPAYVVSNVQYSGVSYSFSEFDATNTNLNLTTGILLTTGTTTNNGYGPFGPNDNGGAGMDNGAPGYPLLTALIGNSTLSYDASVLEFDFVPLTDSISINFVFGSEEYPEYVGSTFNDVFGFFLSGPGIVGVENIAKLPNGEAISVNNVNAGNNASYYVNNGDGTTAPHNTADTVVQYDGYTRNTTASHSGMQVNATYHLIIAIADAGDGILDSGLFIESCETCNYMVGLEENDDNEVLIYPNPAKNTLNIKRADGLISDISVINVYGQQVLTSTLHKSEETIDVSQLASGTYFVRLTNSNGASSIEKIIIQ